MKQKVESSRGTKEPHPFEAEMGPTLFQPKQKWPSCEGSGQGQRGRKRRICVWEGGVSRKGDRTTWQGWWAAQKACHSGGALTTFKDILVVSTIE